MATPADQVDAELAAVGAILVEDRVLRRIIKRHRHLPGIGLQVPHAWSYALPRAELAELIEADALPIALDRLPDHVALISGVRTALAAGASSAWRQVWRAVFHARVHETLERRDLTPAEVRQRISAIGQTEFDEVRLVLRQEDLLLPPAGDTDAYVEFVALYLELRHFAPRTLDETFPVLGGGAHIDPLIAADVDAAALLVASRPARAPREAMLEGGGAVASPRRTAERRAVTVRLGERAIRRSAASARAQGNHVRAAIGALRIGERAAARADLDLLVTRLARALGDAPAAGWTDTLLALAETAATERVLRHTANTRLLLDLQAACTDGERDVEVVDVGSWLRSRGRRTIVRRLPATREVRVARRVRAAARQLVRCELDTDDARDAVADLVHALVERANAQVRTVLRPVIERTLAEVGLVPRHLPGQVAQKKLVDELLDRAVAVGRLSLGDLRDAFAHNDLKLPDLTVRALVTRDQLLRADHLLATELDGVYRRGEIYLRFLQKVSSVLSGTGLGRLLSLYVLLPVVGAFFVVEGAHHMAAPVARMFHGEPPEISTRPVLIGMAVFVFLLLHAVWFRRAVLVGLRAIGRVLKVVFVDTAARLWRIALVRQALRWVILPAIPAALVAWLVPGVARWPSAAATLVVTAAFINSAAAEEVVSDWLLRSSRQLAHRILPGLVKYSLEFFGWLIELVERGIYRVDEALRFRPNQSRRMAIIKGVLATIWFAIAYVLRIYVNLLIEPTVNPVKHFPVVTVAAKLILPFLPQMTTAIAGPIGAVVGPTLGASFAAFTVLVLPGIAGFLAWELNSNWKLYQANRPAVLEPEKIGSHGETMGALLRPGFHSGTLPKLFARLRRATWKGDARAVAKAREGVHHAEEAVRHFVDRQLVALLNQDLIFRATDVAVPHVEVGSNRLRIELACPSVGPGRATIAIEEQSGWLVASVPQRGWLAALDGDQRRVVEIALAGFYKLSGIDLVREQLEAVLADGGLPGVAYDLADDRLVVWPGAKFEVELVYDLTAPGQPAAVYGPTWSHDAPKLGGHHALFGREPIATEAWATTWERLALGMQPAPLNAGPPLLGR
ncbi:MAG: hypothetical protein IPL61_20980 [Myxococcales bacterium]|nr:hypothetical protein [Myxococcales bacterium]